MQRETIIYMQYNSNKNKELNPSAVLNNANFESIFLTISMSHPQDSCGALCILLNFQLYIEQGLFGKIDPQLF
jgi:hypothetical protein